MSANDEVQRALDEFDRVFASGDADALTELFRPRAAVDERLDRPGPACREGTAST
jgi:hypothetical protein